MGMGNIFELSAKLILNKTGFDNGLDDAETKANSSGSKIGSALKTAATAGVAAVTAAATAISTVVTKSVEAYGNYEQLVGGVETLFGAGGQSLDEYAASIGKSTTEAKKQYDSLMSAQNTVLENAANAYQTAGLSANDYMETVTSFSAALVSSVGGDTEKAATIADQALTDMSDNANKMGTDMESIQNAYQGFAKQNYTMLDNLKLGYGGTKEEMERLISDANELAVAQGEAGDLTIDSYADVVEAIHLVQDNMGITDTTAHEAFTTIEGSIGQLKASWENLLTGLSDPDADLGTLMTNVMESATTAAGNILPVIEQALTSIGMVITETVPQIMEQIPTVMTTVVPDLISSAASLVSAIAEGLLNNVGTLVSTASDLISQFANGISSNTSTVVPKAVEIVKTIASAIISNLPSIVQSGLQIITSLATSLISYLPVLVKNVPKIITTIVSTLVKMLPSIISAGGEIISALAQAIVDSVGVVVDGAATVVQNLKDCFLAAVDQVIEVGTNIVNGLWEGIQNAWHVITDGISGLVGGMVDGVKSLLGIHSPSKVFEKQVGEQIANGLIKGIDNKKANAKKSANELAEIYVESAKTKIETLEHYDKITEAEEVGFWQTILKQCKKGTSAYKEAYRELYDAKKQLKEDIASLDEDYKTQQEEINTSLIESIESVNQAYEDAVESRRSSIVSSMALFDEFVADEAVDSSTLISNLQGQVDALAEWNAVLDNLAARQGMDSDLLSDLEDLGVSSLETLKAINNMSDAELEQYVALYKTKNEIALTRAKEENKALYEESQTQIDQLIADAKTQLEELDKTYEASLKELGVSVNTNATPVGENMVKGILTGIANEEGGLLSYVESVCNSMVAAAQAALQIHSPSRVFAKIGSYMAEGMEVGWSDQIDATKKTITNDLKFGTAEIQNATADALTFAANSLNASTASKNNITIKFDGSMGQLVRVLNPYIAAENNRTRIQLVGG